MSTQEPVENNNMPSSETNADGKLCVTIWNIVDAMDMILFYHLVPVELRNIIKQYFVIELDDASIRQALNDRSRNLVVSCLMYGSIEQSYQYEWLV